MANKIKLLVLPLVASALFFHGASNSTPEVDMDQANADQANVDLTEGATDNYWGGGWYGSYGAPWGVYNPYLCDVNPFSVACAGYGLGYGGYGLGYGGWGGGWGGWGGGWGRGGHRHHRHHGHHRGGHRHR